MPGEATFTLVIDSQRSNARTRRNAGFDTRNQFLGVVFNPAGLRIILLMLDNTGNFDFTVIVDTQCTRAGGALVYGKN